MTGGALKVLIADDDQGVVWVLERFFSDRGMDVLRASDGVEALGLLNGPDVRLALIDINMPGKDGLIVLKEAVENGSRATFIIMTAEATMRNTLAAMKYGAFDYITKPFDLDELDVVVEKALENVRLKDKVESLSERLKEHLAGEAAFIGKSKAVQNVFKTVGKVAAKDVTVLILGESGTGKELLARLIHAESQRSAGPFVAVNSAAIPKGLMESELFGYEKGAFTGATEAKKGKFELAEGGTIFLDEIGDMAMDLQARLLRALQEREFYRVGGRGPVKADVRIISATNQDIEKAAVEKRFREDLLYRINGVTVTLPPLRDRKGDAVILAGYFLERFCREFNAGQKSLSEKAIEAVENYHWPGNVRELENAIRRAVLLCPGPVITSADLNLPESRQKRESLEEVITARLRPFIDKTGRTGKQELYDLMMPFMERPLIKLVLERSKGNQVLSAEVLGINRNTLRKKIKRLKINVSKARE